jgi:hypothetical protein
MNRWMLTNEVRCSKRLLTFLKVFIFVLSGKTASGGCSAGQSSSEPVAPRI